MLRKEKPAKAHVCCETLTAHCGTGVPGAICGGGLPGACAALKAVAIS
jgi:hypothetical protein